MGVEEYFARLIAEFLERRNPQLTRTALERAPNLFAAGVDSLGFILLIEKLELATGNELPEDQHAAMSNLNLAQLASVMAGQLPPVQALALTTKCRLTQLFQELPRLLDADIDPVIAFGGSGVGTGLDPRRMADQLDMGPRTTVLNLGFIGLPSEVKLDLANAICRMFRDKAKRSVLTLLEFDPMGYCAASPPTDNGLRAWLLEHLSSGASPVWVGEPSARAHVIALHGWDPARGGGKRFDIVDELPTDVALAEVADAARRTARRAGVIADVYSGRIPFVAEALDHFIEIHSVMRDISERVVPFVFPCDPARRVSIDPADNLLHATVDELETRLGVPLVRDSEFQVESGDFMDINHFSPAGGHTVFSRELARLARTYPGRKC